MGRVDNVVVYDHYVYYSYVAKIEFFQNILANALEIKKYMKTGYDYLLNGGCSYGGKTFVEVEYNNCIIDLDYIICRSQAYIEKLEKALASYKDTAVMPDTR